VKVTFFVPSMAGGGAERVICNISNALVNKGVDVALLLMKKEGPFLGQLNPKIPVEEVGSYSTRRSLGAVVRYLRTHPDRVFFSALDNANIVTSFAGALNRKAKTCVSIHNTLSQVYRADSPSYLKRRAALMRFLYPRVTGRLCVSAGVADDAASFLGIARSRFKVVYNPCISPELFQKSTEPLHDERFSSLPEPRLVAIGRLHEQKDYPTLLKAVQHLKDNGPISLTILGEGPLLKKLAIEAKALGVDDAVYFAGFQSNPYPYLRASNALVLSSRYEGFGVVLAEAIALGIPVASTDCPHGPAEILNNGEFGYLAPVGDPKGLAESISQTLSSPRSVPQGAWQRFTLESIADEYRAYLQELAA
jgi:glycosyltransferase involved in cell wall biosynthesis